MRTMMAPAVRLLRSQDLSASEVASLRRLLDTAFDGDFSEDDWQHARGGWHALIEAHAEVIAHAAVVERLLWVGERRLRAGYVEAVAVAPARQRQGLGRAVMTRLHAVIREHFDLGALSSGEWAFYESLGWQRWQGPSYVRAADGRLTRTADDDDGIMVLASPAGPRLDFGSAIVCEARAGDSW